MADGDTLKEILALARQELPEIPQEVLDRLEKIIRANYGTQRIYIAAHKKRRHLEALSAADGNRDADALADILGVSVRRVQQLKRLR